MANKIELNFGKPEFAKKCPGPDYPGCVADLIVWIPEEGVLPRFGVSGVQLSPGYAGGISPPYIYGPDGYEFEEYGAIKVALQKRSSTLDRPSVIVGPVPTSGTYAEVELVLLWIRERGEWVALWHRNWLENVWGTDDSYDGPFEIDTMCANKILQAYGILDKTVPLDEVRGVSPEQLLRTR